MQQPATYIVTRSLGKGSFGEVMEAQVAGSSLLVALKQVPKTRRSRDSLLHLREVSALRRMLGCPNIIQLLDCVDSPTAMILVLQKLDRSLLDCIKESSRRGDKFSEHRVRDIVRQTLNGLQYIHAAGMVHRDLKPENILFLGDTVYIADFGLVRNASERSTLTEYISTRWYRAPEIILKSRNYSFEVDLWALGCMVFEMATLRPFLPGESELDQLFRIIAKFGSPFLHQDDATRAHRVINFEHHKSSGFEYPARVSRFGGGVWPDAFQLAANMGIRLPKDMYPKPLDLEIPGISLLGVDLFAKMMTYDPSIRLTAQDALRHPWFHQDKQKQVCSPRLRQHSTVYDTITTDSIKSRDDFTPSPPKDIVQSHIPISSPIATVATHMTVFPPSPVKAALLDRSITDSPNFVPDVDFQSSNDGTSYTTPPPHKRSTNKRHEVSETEISHEHEHESQRQGGTRRRSGSKPYKLQPPQKQSKHNHQSTGQLTAEENTPVITSMDPRLVATPMMSYLSSPHMQGIYFARPPPNTNSKSGTDKMITASPACCTDEQTNAESPFESPRTCVVGEFEPISSGSTYLGSPDETSGSKWALGIPMPVDNYDIGASFEMLNEQRQKYTDESAGRRVESPEDFKYPSHNFVEQDINSRTANFATFGRNMRHTDNPQSHQTYTDNLSGKMCTGSSNATTDVFGITCVSQNRPSWFNPSESSGFLEGP